MSILRIVLAAMLFCGVVLSVSPVAAQVITKADNNTALNDSNSYTPPTAPTASNTILIAQPPLTANRISAVNADFSILGLEMTSNDFTFTISGGTGIMTIGAGGITKTNNASLTLATTIALGANQTWTINAGNASTRFNLNVPEIIDNGYSLQVTGGNRLDITRTGNVTLTNNVNLNTGSVIVNNSATVVTLGNANQTDSFQVIKGRAIGSTLGNFGVASSFGDGGTNSAIIMGGGSAGDFGFLEYTGGDASSNRTFNFDRRTNGSEIRNMNASSTLTLSGAINNNQGGVTANSTYSFGGSGSFILSGSQQLKDNTDASFVTSLAKNGTGRLTITGDNSNTAPTSGTFQGATNVNNGVLVVEGTGSINSTSGISVADGAGFIYDSSTALTKGITLASGSRIGGDGSINAGALTLGSGVNFVFDPLKTLDVTGAVSLANSFSVSSLVNIDGTMINWSGIADGTYTLINNGSDFSNISNFGLVNAADIGGGRSAYFQNGSLQLVVVPEPSTYLLGLLGLGAVAGARRLGRMRRSAAG
jgi:autotransporter-associated beta strand protein